MSDDKATPKKGVRTVADLKVTGRNKEGEEPLTFGESIHAVFAEHSDAGITGSLEPTDPIVRIRTSSSVPVSIGIGAD